MFQLSRWGRLLAAVAVCALLASTSSAQFIPPQYIKTSLDGTPIPDVNKASFSNPLDASCWLASASNILAAAGYGSGGAAQDRAQGIYNQLTAAYGIFSGGAPDQAISYWLAMYGKNPDSAEYQPLAKYTDVTAFYGSLGQSDYTFLQAELLRCQYVGVQFENPAHAMTLVGWDNTLNQSIWHDSDNDVGPGGDDPYVNSFTASPTNWDLNDPLSGTTYLNHANGYVTLCPGLDKTPDYVANYDLAWAPGPNGPMAREAGVMAPLYGAAPGWQGTWIDPNDPSTSYEPFLLNNQQDPIRQKRIELLVDYYGRDANYINEDIRLHYLDEFGMDVVAEPTSKELSDDNGQVLLKWELDTQPGWEEIFFPSYMEYGMLEGNVASWNVATICVPEPGSLALLAVAGLGMLAYARRRRRR